MGSGHDHGSGQGDRLHHRELDVAGARRQVEHEIIQMAPVHLPQELLRVAGDKRPAEHHGRAGIREKAHGHQFHAVTLDRDDAVVVRRGGLLRGPEHERDARAVEVAVAEPCARPAETQGLGEVRRNGAFAHAPLATRNGNHMIDAFDLRGAGRRGSRGFLLVDHDMGRAHSGHRG